MKKTHKHVCGDITTHETGVVIVDLAVGCGHIYRHSHSKEHKCPKCGKPVTKYIYHGELIVTINQNKITCT
jgi:hypothetical protein